MKTEDERYELIPFEDPSLPVRLNTDSTVLPGQVSYSPELCLWHEQLELLIPRSGTMKVFIADGYITAKPGEMAVVNPYEVHLVVSCGEISRYDCLMIDPALYRDAARGISSEGWLRLLSEGHLSFENLVSGTSGALFHADQICAELREKRIAYDLMVRSHVIGLMAQLFRSHLAAGSSPEQTAKNASSYDRIMPAIQLIKSDLSQRPSLDDLAAACHLSPSHFSRLFRQIVGSAPQKFDAQIRLKTAASLLKSTDLTVTEIARSVGFDDPAYFARSFRQRFGVTPSEARSAAGSSKE